VQAGILEDRPADSGVRSALLADPQLSERQKQVLIEIYESFRRENAAGGSAEDESAEQETGPAALAGGAPGAEADIVEAIAEAIAEEASGAEVSAAEVSAAEGSGAGGESPPDDTSDKSGHTSDQAVPPIRDQAVPPIR